ncbi:hypothetical protein GF312_02780 [Candidatus Poribacteria bacterium]|nr:hypothetical protein [Candidatus Poribacteria bacterium]
MEVWEREDYRRQARQENKIGQRESELQKTGFYAKFIEMRENYYQYRYSIEDESNLFLTG